MRVERLHSHPVRGVAPEHSKFVLLGEFGMAQSMALHPATKSSTTANRPKDSLLVLSSGSVVILNPLFMLGTHENVEHEKTEREQVSRRFSVARLPHLEPRRSWCRLLHDHPREKPVLCPDGSVDHMAC